MHTHTHKYEYIDSYICAQEVPGKKMKKSQSNMHVLLRWFNR